MLSFQVIGQKLIRRDTTEVVENQYQYVYAAFNFSIDWNGMNVNAVFDVPTEPDINPTPQTKEAEAVDNKDNDVSEYPGVIETNKKQYVIPIVHGVCIVPWEIIKNPSFTFSLNGFNFRKTITTNTITIPVIANPDAPIPQYPPSMLAYEACFALVNQYMEKCDNYYNELNASKAQVDYGTPATLPAEGTNRDVYMDFLNHRIFGWDESTSQYIPVGADYLMLETATAMPVTGIAATKNLNVHMMQQSYTSNWWTTNNPILMNGEIGVESDTRKFKFGDGVHQWNDLKYSCNNGAIAFPRQPLMADYQYDIGTIWVNTVDLSIWILVYNAENNAKWQLMEHS